MNGQPTLKREYRVVGEGREHVRRVFRDGSEPPPTREQFEQMLQQIESHLDTLEKKMGELGDQVTDQGQDTLNEMNETMVQLRSTTFCDLPFYGPPEQ